MPTASRISGLGIHLPDRVRTTEQTERELRARNPGLHPATGLIRRMTGVRSVHVKPDGWQASDLAVAAAREALAASPGPVDLLLFASASQDLVEPAEGMLQRADRDAALVGDVLVPRAIKAAAGDHAPGRVERGGAIERRRATARSAAVRRWCGLPRHISGD